MKISHSPDGIGWHAPAIHIKTRRPPKDIPNPRQNIINEGDIWVDADHNIWVYMSGAWNVMSSGQVRPGTHP